MRSQLEKQLHYFPSDYLTSSDLSAMLTGSANARHAQVKRALKEAILIRLRKGIYRRAKYLEKRKPHPFEMSYYILWPSYVSLESAMSYHGLIPEAVYNTTCVTTNRSLTVQNEFGIFSYKRLPNEKFFIGVTREEENESVFFIASPWKAIADYIYCYKKNWVGMEPLEESLRVDISELPPLKAEFAKELSGFYNSKRIDRFLKSIIKVTQ